MNDLLARSKAMASDLLTLLSEVVAIDTGTGQAEGVRRAGGILADNFTSLGFRVEAVPAGDYGQHLVAKRAGSGRPLLILGHLDTVHAPGSARRPAPAGEDMLAAPGIYDCKGGLIVCLLACRLWQEFGWPPFPLTVLINADEEVGSLTSRTLIEAEAAKARAALIVEPAPGADRVITARKGIGRYVLRVFGRSAHAGSDRAAGINAVVEMAAKILALEQTNAADSGFAVTVGTVTGGVRPNVVPDYAAAEIDLRLSGPEHVAPAEEAIRRAAAVTQVTGANYRLEGGITRPPMPENEGNRLLFSLATEAADVLGLKLQAASTGGGSDGNFCAALGVPTLDGLGPEGGGAHAGHEWIHVPSLPVRGALLVELGRRLAVQDFLG